jgi:hypothetical protein
MATTITNLSVSGNAVLGASSSDPLVVNASVSSSLVPATGALNLGSGTNKWNAYLDNLDISGALTATSVTATTASLGATTVQNLQVSGGTLTFSRTDNDTTRDSSITSTAGNLAFNVHSGTANTQVTPLVLGADGSATFSGSVDLPDTTSVRFGACR